MKLVAQLSDLYDLLGRQHSYRVIPRGYFDIIRIADLSAYYKEKSAPVRRVYYKVSLVFGKSEIIYANQRFKLNGAAMVFTNPEIPYQWHTISKEQRGFVCIFTMDFLSGLANPEDFSVFSKINHAVVSLAAENSEKLLQLMENMSKEIQSDYPKKYDLLRFMLMQVIHFGQKLAPELEGLSCAQTANERIAGQFMKQLEAQFPILNKNQQILLSSAGAFAHTLNIHINHLNKALKEITGKSTSAIIHQRMMSEAGMLLKDKDWRVNEISRVLGFTHESHFSTFFKRHTKLSPSAFRKKID